jgi:O-succinylbenzoic acid--CoA ligase
VDDWVAGWATKRPEHPAVDGLSYEQLDESVSRCARRLVALGVEAGDRVATTLPPSPAFAELLHALPRLGAALVPLNPASAGPQLDVARPALLVEEPLDGDEADVEPSSRCDPEAVHTVVFTSGTTGRPKAVELTLANHAASAIASAWTLGVAPDDRWLCPLPLFHVGGLAILMRSALYGTTALLHDGFNAQRVKRSLQEGEATLVSLVPTMLVRLRDAGLERAPALRAALLGGGPVPGDLLEWARKRDLPVMGTYGMTECASQVATAAPGELAAAALPGVELRVEPDGEILVRGPMVARDALAADGWLHTGDLGRLDEHGRLRVEGRLKEVIVTGGENVAAAEVEEALVSHPDVADAAVVGRPDPEWGEAVTAFVVLRPGVAPVGLEDWCRERLAAFKVPKRIATVETLPRSPAGKLLRDRLPS